MSDKKALYFFSNRVLLIYLLLFNLENTIFITYCDYYEENKKFYNKLSNNLILIKNYEVNNILKKRIFTPVRKYILRIFYFRNAEIKKIIKENIDVYGQDHSTIGKILVKKTNFFLIEDGTINYKNFKEIFFKKILKNLLGLTRVYGREKKVKKIYLTGLAPIPEEIKNKVEIIDLKKLWEQKTKEEQQEILEIFGFNNIINKLKERDIILFTQPLSEDGIISEQEKVNLYSKIVSKYPNEKLILKRHPREKTNYMEIFKEVLVLEENFPSEIFDLLEINFKKGVTLFSTAVLNCKTEEIDFYGTEVHSKLIEKFGSMDHIIKRNKFL